jgi:hypothetical protein
LKIRGGVADVTIAAIAATIMIALLAVFAWFYNPGEANARLMILLSGIAGAAAGWPAGVIISPYDDTKEEIAFQGIGRALYGIAVGYAVAKLDPLVTGLATRAGAGTLDPLLGVCLLVGAITFLVVATLAYVSRRYWS